MSKVSVDTLPKVLKHYLEGKYNVLIVGEHGIGKTACVKEVFTSVYNDDWLYFSAPTMDPYIDFVGVPKIIEQDGQYVLKLIRNEKLRTARALFFDELNRAPRKVLNSIFELIQFKTINGIRLDNLEVIWAAINPPGKKYNVEPLDPAIVDRFHLSVTVVPKFPKGYFAKRFSSDIAHRVVNWWENLSSNEKEDISFRRIEYAVDYITRFNRPPVDFFNNNSTGKDLYNALTNVRDKVSSLIENISDDVNNDDAVPEVSLIRAIEEKRLKKYNNVLKTAKQYSFARAKRDYGIKIFRDFLGDLHMIYSFYKNNEKRFSSDVKKIFNEYSKIRTYDKIAIVFVGAALNRLSTIESYDYRTPGTISEIKNLIEKEKRLFDAAASNDEDVKEFIDKVYSTLYESYSDQEVEEVLGGLNTSS